MIIIPQEANVLVVAGDSPDLENDMLELHGAYNVCACNRASRRLCFLPDYWAVWHVDWIPRLREGGCPEPIEATISQFEAPGVRQVRVEVSGGSVTLYAVLAGLKMGFKKIITAGVCLNFGEYTRHRRGWIKKFNAEPDFGRKVRGLSGFPAELLRRPDEAWLKN